jgi:hypothetical protein
MAPTSTIAALGTTAVFDPNVCFWHLADLPDGDGVSLF